MWKKCTVAAALWISLPAGASVLTVEGAISPAWVERADGRREPLVPGMTLADRDKVQTGSGARAWLRLSEGSVVKLGEDAMLAVDRLLERRSGPAQRLVTGSFDLIRGAIRFTTEGIGRRSARDLSFKITTLTTGIRGTDLWAKVQNDRDVVCLIEGSITVTHNDAAFALSEPRMFLVAPRGHEPLPVASVSTAQIAAWTSETDIGPGHGAARRGGTWRVVVSVAPDQASALASYDRLRAAGYPARIRPVKTEASLNYDVHIGSLPAERDAAKVAAQLRELGFAEAKVVK